ARMWWTCALLSFMSSSNISRYARPSGSWCRRPCVPARPRQMAACGYRDSHKRYYGTSGSWLNITQQMPDRAEKSSAAGECVVRHLDPQSVEGGIHVGRQLAAQLFVIEIGMEIGQDRAAGLDPRDPRERVLDTEMARMRPVAQRVHDPDLGPGKGRDAGLGQAAEVAGIAEPPAAESQGGDIAMLLQKRHR